MRAVILSIGSELVTGLRLDTHATEIARALGPVGLDVVRHETLDDDEAAIAGAFKRAAAEAEVILATGGLGPTPDDCTRQGLARAMGVPLEENAESLAHLQSWAKSRGLDLAESNLRQALLPRGASVLANRIGSAPGIAAALGRARVFCMPGVPSEMRLMLAEQVLPQLRGVSEARVRAVRTVRTFGLPESAVGERLADLMAPGRLPRVATAVHMGIIDVHIHAAGPQGKVERLLAADVEEVKRRLGSVVFGENETCLEEAVSALLARRHATVALAESCTGGLVAAKLVNVPGMSEFLLEALVAYSNEAKVRSLGVPEDLLAEHGAVSEPVARAMAEGIRARTGADFAVAVTGIAGPGGGTPAKPVGTVCFALADAIGTRSRGERFPGDRTHVRERAANYALNLLRLRLMGGECGGGV